MVKVKTSDKKALKDLLLAFDGDPDVAIQALEEFKLRSKKQSSHTIKTDAPVVVDIQNVSKRYKVGSQHIDALSDVSLQIRQGEFIAITGSSGSGKSTLLQLIGGLDKPSSGDVVVDGKNISKLSDRKLSVFRNKTIGFVFQFFYLQPFLKLQTNIEVPAMFARRKTKDRAPRAKELAEEVSLADRLSHLPKELSGGQMQRAAIARALENNPKIILADEPTGNLDSTNGDGIIELFEKIRTSFNTTVVVVTHDPKVATRADREICLKDGVLLA